ncbi:MAG: transporter substrate-binding domain-containing protein [Gammaproteobacteria bacterium]|nr:transporter substrate-binding domain-containing protein [Gammaproteobacteria bacterium]
MKPLVHILILSLSSLIQAQTIQVAVDDFPPYSQINQDGTITGLNVDVVNSVSKRMGLEVNYIPCPWVRCLKLLEKGDVDLMSGVLLTPERAENYQFVYPPYESVMSNSVYFYQLTSKPLIKAEADLYNKIVAVQRGVVYTPEFDNNEDIVKVEINDHSSIIKMLLKGNIDAFIYAGVAAEALIEKHDLNNEIIRSPLSYKSVRNTHLVLSKNSPFVSKADRFGEELAHLLEDNTIKQIFQKYGIEHSMTTPESD